MKKLFCLFAAAFMLTCVLCGCSKIKGKPDSSSGVSVPAETTLAPEGKAFFGKWEAYKALVYGEVYENEYAGFPISAVARLEVFEDNTAVFRDALNKRGKEVVYNYNWTLDEKSDTLHLVNRDDKLDCVIEQGQMIITYADYDDGTKMYLTRVNEFSDTTATTEAGLDKLDFSDYEKKWEAVEVKNGEEVFTETLGEYPVNAAFQLEIKPDNTAVMNIIGESQTYEWEAESKDQLYMWSGYEGFAVTLKDGELMLDDENGMVLRMKRVDKFTEYDFEAANELIPDDENIILNPEEEPTT